MHAREVRWLGQLRSFGQNGHGVAAFWGRERERMVGRMLWTGLKALWDALLMLWTR
jgi:hypothetical protein